MKHGIANRFFVVVVAMLFVNNAAAQSLDYFDVVTVPQVNSKMSNGNNGAQKKAVNLMCDINPICGMSKALIPSKERISKMAAAINRGSKVLSRPNVGLISSDEILNYPYVNRYLTELDDKEISHYYILREDYKFQDLSGENITIPAGFIWDGASIPTGFWVEVVALDVGNTRYNSALAEGLIHDYMYRDPRRFSKEDADDLLYVNLVRCGNANPIAIYEGVHVAGGDSYQGHKRRQDQGLYGVFTPKFYKENLKIFQDENKRSNTTDTLKQATQSGKTEKVDVDHCRCAVPDDRDFYCKKCGKISKWLAPRRDKEFEQMLKRGSN